MKFDLVKDELSNLLEELMEQFHTIDSHEKAIPQIEMDIFMRNIQKLYENTLFLNKINESKEHLKPSEEKEEIVLKEKTEPVTEKIEETIVEGQPEIIAQEIIEEPKVEDKPEITAQEIAEEPIAESKPEIIIQEIVEGSKAEGKPEIFAHEIVEEPKEAVIDEVEAQVEEQVQAEEQIKPQAKAHDKLLEHVMIYKPKAEAAPIEDEIKTALDEIVEDQQAEADLFSEVNPSSEINDLNEKLADARNTHSIVEKLQNNRIESLKSVIGINDKFYFINELFGGDTQKYEDIIYTLNNFKKLDEAMQYFSTLKYRFAWDEQSEPYAKLTHMLERKFNLIDA